MGQKHKKKKTEKNYNGSGSLGTYVKYCGIFVAVFCAVLLISQQIHAIQTPQFVFSGSGLQAEPNLPARYFYGELKTYFGARIDIRNDHVEADIKLDILESSGKPAAHDRELGFKHDGRVIFRYRLRYSMPDGFIVKISVKGRVVLKKRIRGEAYDEKCNCPSPLNQFYDEYKCPAVFEQLDSNFDAFKGNFDLDELLVAGKEKRWINGGHGEATAHIVIKDQRLYVKDLGTIMGFRPFLTSMLLSLLRKVSLPDVEFIFNLGDWPLEDNFESPLPIFGWCGSTEQTDIPLPTWDQTKNTRHSLYRERKDIQYIEQSSGNMTAWENKKEIGYFRGRDSNPSRLTLCELSVNEPDVVDARLTWNLHNKKGQDPKRYGAQVKHVTYDEMAKHKYQILVDGTVAPYRTANLLQLDTVIFKQKSKYYEWWYIYMEPWVHFIPLEDDLSDLKEKINWARDNDEKVQEIVANGNALVAQWINPELMYCYYAKAFEKYAAKMSRPVQVTAEHEELTHQTDADLNGNWVKYWRNPSCSTCHKQQPNKDEL